MDRIVWGEVGGQDPLFHFTSECKDISADGTWPLYWSQAKERIMLPRVCETCAFNTKEA